MDAITWTETTSERFNDMLGAVPPAVMTGLGFLLGEAQDHNEAGRPVFRAFAEVGGRHFEAEQYLTVGQFRAIKPAEWPPRRAAMDCPATHNSAPIATICVDAGLILI